MSVKFTELMKKLKSLGDAIRSRAYVDDKLTFDQMKAHVDTLIKTDKEEYSMGGSLIQKTLYGYKVPDGIVTLNPYAFAGCTNLREVILPESFSVIDNYMFQRCENLKLTDLPAGLTKIGPAAFSDCTGLTEIIFHSKPTTINGLAFQRCTNLTSIKVPWAEGEVTGAPWGATNATITYNYTE